MLRYAPIDFRKPTQVDLFNAAHRKTADGNEAFLWLIENGLTREDVERGIRLRPAYWSRFSGYIDKLPSEKQGV